MAWVLAYLGHYGTILAHNNNNTIFMFLFSYLMQAAISCGGKEVKSSVESGMDDGRGGSTAERESGYWLLDKGILDLQPGTSGAG